MVRSKGGRFALVVLTVGMERAIVGDSGPVLTRNETCNVCRGVTQGFLDLHTEWSLVRNIEKVASSSRDHAVDITYEAAIERFCKQSFLSGNQQRVCYSIAPFAAEVGKWLGMRVSTERICRKLARRNPETCFDARDETEGPSPNAAELLLDWRSRPPSIPEGVDCSIEHRNSVSPRWVLLD